MSAEKTAERRGKRRRRSEDVVEEEMEADESFDDAEDRGLTEGKGRATPGRRRQEERAVSSNIVVRGFNTLREYLDGVVSEVGKVAWPTREETLRLATAVLITTIISAIVLGLLSFLFSRLFALGLESPALLFGILFLVIAAVVVLIRILNRQARNL